MTKETKKIEIEVDVSVNDVDKYIAKQIIESRLGEYFKESFEEALGRCTNYYDSPLKRFTESVIEDYFKELLKEEKYRAAIKKSLEKILTDDRVDDIVRQGTDKLISSFRDNH